MNTEEITALMVEPGKHPKVTKLKDDLDSLQKAVSIGADYQGLIEFMSLGNNDCIISCSVSLCQITSANAIGVHLMVLANHVSFMAYFSGDASSLVNNCNNLPYLKPRD